MKKYIENLDQIEKLSDEKIRENIEFKLFLKMQNPKRIDAMVGELDKEIKANIDCLDCGNCCHILKIPITKSDVERISRLENLEPGKYVKKYTEIDTDDGLMYMKQSPCRYLDGNFCKIYAERPLACRAFPYIDKPDFTNRTNMMSAMAAICPIVFNLLEELKLSTDFHHNKITGTF